METGTRAGGHNPFAGSDPDRAAIWDMLVRRDIEAYLAQDWSRVAGDFVAGGFVGIDGQRRPDPDAWRLTFPDLGSYRDVWLRQAAATAATDYAEDVGAAIFAATSLAAIEIAGDHALAHKKFDGSIARADGGSDRLLWQTLYICRQVGGAWKIAGFVGYLPYAPDGGAPGGGAPGGAATA